MERERVYTRHEAGAWAGDANLVCCCCCECACVACDVCNEARLFQFDVLQSALVPFFHTMVLPARMHRRHPLITNARTPAAQ